MRQRYRFVPCDTLTARPSYKSYGRLAEPSATLVKMIRPRPGGRAYHPPISVFIRWLMASKNFRRCENFYGLGGGPVGRGLGVGVGRPGVGDTVPLAVGVGLIE